LDSLLLLLVIAVAASPDITRVEGSHNRETEDAMLEASSITSFSSNELEGK